ncbi:putative ferric-chelate reductase 1 [Thalassophryne amazonica]|uniref:putative ferric-chelate reductase 1 n=1 Tax=Thalassophryne amazonica TaxID=390379 RepID=UPI001470C087|nr:putative ferric-chelate reductase 1 [Thalassophryne amazonica]
MERGLSLLVAIVLVSVAPCVHGTFHLSFSPDLPVNISRDGCGRTKLCISKPNDCDPVKSTSCLFGSFNTTTNCTTNGTNCTTNATNYIRDVNSELSGQSEGYIAMGSTLNISAGVSLMMICGRNANNSFFFQTMERNNTNNVLMPIDQTVSNIRGKVNQSLIQCEFTVPNYNTSRALVLFLATGSVNGSTLGPLNISLVTAPLDLNNPASNVPTTAPPTGNRAAGVTPAHALVLLLNIATLLALLKP